MRGKDLLLGTYALVPFLIHPEKLKQPLCQEGSDRSNSQGLVEKLLLAGSHVQRILRDHQPIVFDKLFKKKYC